MSDGWVATAPSLLLLQKFTLLKLDCSKSGLIDTCQPQKLPKWYMLPPPPPVCHCVLVHSLVGRQEAEVVGTHLNPAQHSRTHSAHEGTSHLTSHRVALHNRQSLRHSRCPMPRFTGSCPVCPWLCSRCGGRGLGRLRGAGVTPRSGTSRRGLLGGSVSPRWGDRGRPRPLSVLLEELQQRSPAPPRGGLGLSGGRLYSGWVGKARCRVLLRKESNILLAAATLHGSDLSSLTLSKQHSALGNSLTPSHTTNPSTSCSPQSRPEVLGMASMYSSQPTQQTN